MDLGERIRTLRRQRGWTLRQLSEATGISDSHLSLIERSRTRPTLDKTSRIARALEVSVDALMGQSTAEEQAQTPPNPLPPELSRLRDDPLYGRYIDDEWLRLLSGLSIRGRRPRSTLAWLGLFVTMRPYFEDEPIE